MTFPEQPLILPVTERLILRQRMPADAAEMFALTEANRHFLRRRLPWLDHCVREADTLRSIESTLRQAADGTGLAFSLVEDGRIVGVLGWNEIARGNGVGHIGYWLAETHLGRGLMTAGVAALVAYGFETLHLHRQVIAAGTDNLPSRALAERLGFRFEGIARDAENLYGTRVDHALYARLRTDPPPPVRPPVAAVERDG